MSQPKDANYQNLIARIRDLKEEANQLGRQAEHWRMQRKNSVGRDSVQAADAQLQQASDAQSRTYQQVENLMNQVVANYGQGPHPWN